MQLMDVYGHIDGWVDGCMYVLYPEGVIPRPVIANIEIKLEKNDILWMFYDDDDDNDDNGDDDDDKDDDYDDVNEDYDNDDDNLIHYTTTGYN